MVLTKRVDSCERGREEGLVSECVLGKRRKSKTMRVEDSL